MLATKMLLTFVKVSSEENQRLLGKTFKIIYNFAGILQIRLKSSLKL